MEQVTIKDIAKKCKVGVSTVSRAMNNHPDINPETKEMILKVIAESNYVPNNSARNLKRSDAKAIAILVKGMDNMFFNNMISTIEEAARKKKYSCIIERVDEKANEVDTAIEVVKEKRLRGIIFLGGNFTHPHEKMAQIPVPYVISTIGAIADGGKPCASVSVDDYKESYKMVDYLCREGHRRIAIITACEDDISIGKLRLDAYRQALTDHNIPYDPELVMHMTKEDTYSFHTGYQITKKALEKKLSFTAVYATADTLAIGACRALKEAGLTVPSDVSVAGFDGIDAGAYYIPSITTIRQPVEKLAAETARMLFAMISKKEEPHAVVFDGQLIVRESTKGISR
ncbi:MAG: LacI family DNA-binding transcriptional regulator [Fusicatenibacter sp.]|nr:LacI family DNA-binding transcriptional regulator [Lachnospiraceae bacterium]MDY2937986.1 LacI family DNA-binding transcriptional regulator [Fusicatenibacter sp.]